MMAEPIEDEVAAPAPARLHIRNSEVASVIRQLAGALPSRKLSTLALFGMILTTSRSFLWPGGIFYPTAVLGGSYVEALSPGASRRLSPPAFAAVFPSGPLGHFSDASLVFLCLTVAVCLVLGLSLPGYRRLRPIASTLFPLAPFFVLCVMSVLWSYAPIRSFLACSTTGCTFLAAAAAGHFLRSDRLNLRVVAIMLSVLAISVVSSLIQAERSPWMGIFSHKNHFGWFAVLTLCVIMGENRGTWRLARAGGAALCLFCLWKAQSATAFAATAGISLLAITGLMKRQLRIAYLPAMFLVSTSLLLAGFIVFACFPLFAVFLGRDETLTHRTDVWAAYWPFIADHLAVGQGAATFTGSDITFQVAQNIFVLQHWAARHAHSMYVIVLGETGALGLVLYVSALLYLIIVGVAGHKARAGLVGGMLAFVTLIGGVTEPRGGLEPTLSALLAVAYFSASFSETQRSRRRARRRPRRFQIDGPAGLIEAGLA